MKEIIVIAGTIILGCIIFDMMVGGGNSLKTSSDSYFSNMLRQL